jgi:high affinity Mn2+ porin
VSASRTPRPVAGAAHSLAPVSVLLVALAGARALAQAAPPAPHEDVAFDFMNVLSQHGLHDLEDERWNAYGQTTYISSWKLPFTAPYTNLNGSPNSLLPGHERSFTWSATLFLGAKLWPGGEAYFVPEVIAERPLSTLHGLGGVIQNFELQKGGSETPQVYKARLFLRQTFGLGGEPVKKSSDPMQLGTTVDSRRIVITAGNFSVLDVMDRNGVTGDPRQTFFNMAFMTHAAWDFTADARGYSYGAAVELYWDDWAVRFAHVTPPRDPNQLPLDFRLWKYFGDQLEIEHDHVLFGLPGAVRILGYRNRVFTGSFDDAVAVFQADPGKNAAACTDFNYGSQNATAPDLCWVRKDNVKVGIGIALEQFVAKDIGVFLRAMYSDGQSEVDAFNAADRSLAFGAVAKGSMWGRPFDLTGVGLGLSWISSSHARYLALGGIDGFIGDGALRQSTEGTFEIFYSFNLFKAIWLAGDVQLIWNPAYNADRGGPVTVLGAKVHAEF